MEQRTVCETYQQFSELYYTTMRKIASRELDCGPQGSYAGGLMLASAVALCSGIKEIVAIEFGVFEGRGLLSLCRAAEVLNPITGIAYRVVGFDTCKGNPPPLDYRDHPEIWQEGFFPMSDKGKLESSLPPFAKLIEGPIESTILSFRERELSPSSPLGFIAVDVDLYSSTRDSLQVLSGKAEKYLPAVPMYFDDVETLLTYSESCGEALAIREFNSAHPYRTIDRKPSFKLHNLYCCQVLDHPIRTGEQKPVFPFEIKPA